MPGHTLRCCPWDCCCGRLGCVPRLCIWVMKIKTHKSCFSFLHRQLLGFPLFFRSSPRSWVLPCCPRSCGACTDGTRWHRHRVCHSLEEPAPCPALLAGDRQRHSGSGAKWGVTEGREGAGWEPTLAVLPLPPPLGSGRQRETSAPYSNTWELSLTVLGKEEERSEKKPCIENLTVNSCWWRQSINQ